MKQANLRLTGLEVTKSKHNYFGDVILQYYTVNSNIKYLLIWPICVLYLQSYQFTPSGNSHQGVSYKSLPYFDILSLHNLALQLYSQSSFLYTTVQYLYFIRFTHLPSGLLTLGHHMNSLTLPSYTFQTAIYPSTYITTVNNIMLHMS